MVTIQLPQDFKEFLKLLHDYKIEYLIIGDYAVGYYGYPRATGDLDIWISNHPENVKRMVSALKEFGFQSEELSQDIFLKEENIIRLGNPPLRIEILITISGVHFEECYGSKKTVNIKGTPVHFIGLHHLKKNKKASGRHIDLNDLEHLE